MGKEYIGRLPESDPLYGYLRYDIQPQITGNMDRASYRVFRLNASNDVYLYEDRYSGAKFVGKFFQSHKNPDPRSASSRLSREHDNLCFMRSRGLTGYPHHVARPLGRNYSINALLVTEHCEGDLFSNAILSSIHNRDEGYLFYKLTALAYFMSAFHNRTAVGVGVDFNRECDYTGNTIEDLRGMGAVGGDEAAELYWLREQWRNSARMWEDQQVMIHGDATPDNFMFGGGLSVVAIDLERSRRADRAFDLGRIAGEIMHFFYRATGNKRSAEPFIGHFLWEYACHFPDRNAAFRSITGRVPFYMGITLLRISRNHWVGGEYRRRLINEAKECLRRF